MKNWKYITVVNSEINKTWSTWAESTGEALTEASFMFKHGTGWVVSEIQ